MQLTMLLLIVGTVLVFAGRAHVLTHAGVPPRAWIPLEALLAAGPAFGWWSLSLGTSWMSLVLAGVWASLGVLCYAFAHLVVRQCTQVATTANNDPFGEESLTNPMAKALVNFRKVDRTIDFDHLGELQERAAMSRRARLSAERGVSASG